MVFASFKAIDRRAGSSLISVLVAAGASMVVLAGVTTMIQFSQKAGRGAQGTSEFGVVVDSVRTLVSSSASCTSAFVDSGGNRLVFPTPTATPGVVVEAQKISVAGSPLLEKNETLQAITVSKIELTRLKDDPSLIALRIIALKKAGALGKQELQQSKPILIRATFLPDGKIASCNSGSESPAPGPSPSPTVVSGGAPCGPEGKGVTVYHYANPAARYCCYVGGGADSYPFGGNSYIAFSRVPCLPY
jgi:hypothetical protein